MAQLDSSTNNMAVNSPPERRIAVFVIAAVEDREAIVRILGKNGYKAWAEQVGRYPAVRYLFPADGQEEYRVMTDGAFACPVCKGRGFVPTGFYDPTPRDPSTTLVWGESCRSCGGSGLVWRLSNGVPAVSCPDTGESCAAGCNSAQGQDREAET